jgi:hypothetical protein
MLLGGPAAQNTGDMSVISNLRRTGRRRYIESYAFSRALRRKLVDELGSDHAADVALDGLRGWYLACLYADNQLIGMPSKAIDEAWHTMILFTREYETFCRRAFGRYLHHSPDSTFKNLTMDAITAHTLALVDKHDLPMTLFTADDDAGIEDGFHWSSRDLRRLRYATERLQQERKARRRAGASTGFAGGYVASDGSSDGGWSFFGFGGGSDGGGSSCGGGGCGGGGCGGGG